MMSRLFWYWKTDRLGPDILSTHFLLYWKKTGNWLCRRKFRKFGKNSEFRPHAYAVATLNISIGDNVIIRPGCVLSAEPDIEKGGGIIIKDNVAIGPGVHFYDSNHRYNHADRPIIDQGSQAPQTIVVSEGAWIGANAIILPGIKIGMNAVVGAGSVVTKNVEDFTIVAGNPARLIKYLK